MNRREVQYQYRCSANTTCKDKSGVYTTTIPPHKFPSCLWCGAPLEHVGTIEPIHDLTPKHEDCDCLSCRPWTY